METTNRELLEKVVEDRLKRAMESGDADVQKAAFKEAMDAIDRSVELSKIDANLEDQIRNECLKRDEVEMKKEEAKKDRWVKGIEIAGVIVVAPLIEKMCKTAYAKLLCEFEKDYTFTTSAGRALSGLFRFKK